MRSTKSQRAGPIATTARMPMSAGLSPVDQSLIAFNQSPAREAGKPVARIHSHRDAVDASPLRRSDYGVAVVPPVEMTAGT
jgi:hypothetical protein